MSITRRELAERGTIAYMALRKYAASWPCPECDAIATIWLYPYGYRKLECRGCGWTA